MALEPAALALLQVIYRLPPRLSMEEGKADSLITPDNAKHAGGRGGSRDWDEEL